MVLDSILAALSDEERLPRLEGELAAIASRLRAARHPDARAMVRSAEEQVRRGPEEAFAFADDGWATLRAGAHTWSAGAFETTSIAELRQRIEPRHGGATARARLVVLTGGSVLTDIGSLQATNAPDTLFQVASQFNCLESPGPYVTAVSNYFSDPTQGPRASISAFPATLLRHYAAPREDGSRFVQETDGEQLDLLARACGRRVSRNGYLTGEGVPAAFLASALRQNFEQIEVGLHRDAEVVLGHHWDGAAAGGRRIAQAFTSTVAGGSYGGETRLGTHFPSIAETLLRAAYTGTLLGAIALDCRRVVLTLIGGGVFANPPRLIWQAMLDAIDDVQPLLSFDVDVVVNAWQLPRELNVETTILPAVRARGGAVVSFSETGGVAVRR
jgi:hypothetical protein